MATATGSGAAKAGRTADRHATLFIPFQPAQVHIGPRSAIKRATLTLLSSDVLIMSGNYMPEVSPEWMEFVARNFIKPTIGTGYVNTPVATNGQWWPFTGLTSMSLNDSTRAGSRSSTVGSTRSSPRTRLPERLTTRSRYWVIRGVLGWRRSQNETFSGRKRVAKCRRPKLHNALGFHPPCGGLFSRFYGFGLVNWTPILSAPIDTPFPTYDISRQYDFFSDFPAYPLNLLADVNALFGLLNHNYGPVTINLKNPTSTPTPWFNITVTPPIT